MKKIILFIITFLPLFTSAQTLTTAQKDKAVRCATQFCDLLVRYSEGERTLANQINSLCSGADCSAFDDIKTDKEVTLRNYLLAIQQKYPQKLPMAISSPTIAKSTIYEEPIFSIGMSWESVNGNAASTAETLSLTTESIDNYYIAFQITQTYPTLNKSIQKYIIYNVNIEKITAFISNEGPFINFLKGLTAFSKKQYADAIVYFDRASKNDRSALKKRSLTLAYYSALSIMDYNLAAQYAQLLPDSLLIAAAKCGDAYDREDFQEALDYAIQLETLIPKRSDLNDRAKGNLYGMIGTAYLNPKGSHDYNKALRYLQLAMSLGNEKAGYAIYYFYRLLPMRFTDARTATAALYDSALKGFPPAFYPLACLIDLAEDQDGALKWYKDAAMTGSFLGAANVGRIFLEQGDKEDGLEMLRLTLEGNTLDQQLKEFQIVHGDSYAWPNSRADVENLLRKYTTTSTPSSTITNTYTPHQSITSSTTTTSNTSSNLPSNSTTGSSYTPTYTPNHKKRRKFNHPNDEYIGGLSVGYVEKNWKYKYADYSEKVNVFGEPGSTKGFQIGFRFNPQFGYGFGMDYGLFYEYYFGKSIESYNTEDIYYRFSLKEHCLHLPIQLKYALNFSKWFQLSFYGGVGFNWGLKGKIYARDGKETITSFSMYDDELDMKKFNPTLEYGASLRIRCIQFDYSIANGLRNMSGNPEYTVKQNKPMTLCMTIFW